MASSFLQYCGVLVIRWQKIDWRKHLANIEQRGAKQQLMPLFSRSPLVMIRCFEIRLKSNGTGAGALWESGGSAVYNP